MTKSNFYLNVSFYNYRSAIVKSDEDLRNYDTDQLEELVSELDENDEIEWKDDFMSQRRVPEVIESSSGVRYSIVFNDSKPKFDCLACPTVLYVDFNNYVKDREYKCPKCSSPLTLSDSESAIQPTNFTLMQS